MTLENISRLTEFYDSKANIIALSGALDEIRFAYATDTGELGAYVGGAWVWFGAGGGGSDLGLFNVVDFGAIGDGTTSDTTAVQAAIDAAHAAGGIVWYPPGVYKCGNLTTHRNVSHWGSGVGVTTLKASASGSLLVVANASFAATHFNFQGSFKDFTLDGASTGGVGLEINGGSILNIERLLVKGFTGTSVKLRGVLVSTIRDLYVQDAPLGLDLAKIVSTDAQTININAVRIENFAAGSCATWAIKIADSNGVSIEGADIENNGTIGDAATGAVYYQSAGNTAFGLAVSHCWFESNVSQNIFFDTPAVAGPLHTVSDTYFANFGSDLDYGIYVEGSVRAQTVLCRALGFIGSANTADLFANGADATITLEQVVGTTGGAGTIETVSYTGGGGAVTSVGTGVGLTGGPITSSGTINLADTAVTPGSYTYLSAIIDQQGRITAASSGTAPSTTVYAPLVNGDLPGPTFITTDDGQCIMVPIS